LAHNAIQDDAEPIEGSRFRGHSLQHLQSSTSLLKIVSENPESLFLDLLSACSLGRARIVERLLQVIPLHVASRFDKRRGEASFGYTPLHLAKNLTVTKLLVKSGLDVNICGSALQTPLHTTISAEISSYLIQEGAIVDAETVDGSTPLHWAVQSDNMSRIRILVQAGANVNKRNNNGNTPLHLVDSVVVGKYLYEHGARLDTVNARGRIPLEEAAIKGSDEEHLALATFLLDMSHEEGLTFGADIGSDEESETVLGVLNEETDEEDLAEPLASYPESANKEANSAKARWGRVRRTVLRGGMKSIMQQRQDRRIKFAESGISSSMYSAGDTETTESGGQFYCSFFDLMVRDRPELALKMLDKQRKFLYPRGANRVYSYDLTLIGGPADSNSSLDMIIAQERKAIISHEVVQWVLTVKWLLFTRETLHVEFFLNAVFVVALMLTTLDVEQDVLFLLTTHGVKIFQLPDGSSRIPILLLGELFVFLMNLRYFSRHVIEWRMDTSLNGTSILRLLYTPQIEEPFYVVPHICIMAQQVLRSTTSPEDDDIYRMCDILSALACVLLWVRCLYFAEGYEVVGVAMCTIRKMIKDVFIYVLILFTFITGFSHALSLVFRGSESPIYGTMYNSWITLYFFIFNLDVGALDAETSEYRRYFGYFLVGVYMLVVALVILNLIIATMTNTYDAIQQSSKEEWMLTRAAMTMRHEWRAISIDRIYSYIFNLTPSVFPGLPSKLIITEEPDGKVLVEVPALWLHQLNLARIQNGLFHRLRYACFWFWKVKIRRSDSFLWPDEGDSIAFCNRSESQDHEIVIDDCGQNDTPLLAETSRTYGSMDFDKQGSNVSSTSSHAKRLQHFTSKEAAAVRTGVFDEMVYIGRFYRHPRRVQEERELVRSKMHFEPLLRSRSGESGSEVEILSPRMKSFKSNFNETEKSEAHSDALTVLSSKVSSQDNQKGDIIKIMDMLKRLEASVEELKVNSI